MDFIKYLLYPQSVAVIGASKREGSVGNNVLKCILDCGYQGEVYPINPSLNELMSVKCYPSILDVPGRVDMALVVVPAIKVAQVAEECGKKGVHVLVVISDGFRETGPEGLKLEKELLGIVERFGMRMLGPNCIGIINPAADVSLNATFCPTFPNAGSLGVISQSGALGFTILQYAKSIAVGVSFFVSVGNSADLKVTDFLELAAKDQRTKNVILYMESFDNPHKFAALSREISLKKPIVVIKTGRTETVQRLLLAYRRYGQ
jgi:acyl-CoA synthetase (NDP forming)